LRRASEQRERIDGHAIPLASVHDVEPPGMVAPRAALATLG